MDTGSHLLDGAGGKDVDGLDETRTLFGVMGETVVQVGGTGAGQGRWLATR
jgi:3-hydroxyisobutyrate dehydrogenase-like beta-hydroxyacid dehydrogenase